MFILCRVHFVFFVSDDILNKGINNIFKFSFNIYPSFVASIIFLISNIRVFYLQELENRLPLFEHSNLSKLQTLMRKASDAYMQAIRNVSKSQPLCLHQQDLEALHREALQAAFKIYDGEVKKISQKPDLKREELMQVRS